MKMETLHDLFVEEIRDMYNAEAQLVKALPKMAKAASNDQLREAFMQHLEQTREHQGRLEEVFQVLDGKRIKGKRCAGMEGLIEEGNEMMQADGDENVIDAALILSAQKVEHYEIAGYGSLCTFAEILGYDEARELLNQTLEEEKQADEKLTQLAETTVNASAAGEEGMAANGDRRSMPEAGEDESAGPRAKRRVRV